MKFEVLIPRNGYISEYFAECACQISQTATNYSDAIIELSGDERAELEAEAEGMPLGDYIHHLLFDIDLDPDD